MVLINVYFNVVVWFFMILYGFKKFVSGIIFGLFKKKKENEFIENYFI